MTLDLPLLAPSRRSVIPDRLGLVLTESAGQFVELCRGELTVIEVVDRMRDRYPSCSAASIERELLEFLRSAEVRGLAP